MKNKESVDHPIDDQEYLRPPQKDIDRALEIERGVPDAEMDLYKECVNGVKMEDRKSAREQRDGCILVIGVYLRCSRLHPQRYNPK